MTGADEEPRRKSWSYWGRLGREWIVSDQARDLPLLEEQIWSKQRTTINWTRKCSRWSPHRGDEHLFVLGSWYLITRNFPKLKKRGPFFSNFAREKKLEMRELIGLFWCHHMLPLETTQWGIHITRTGLIRTVLRAIGYPPAGWVLFYQWLRDLNLLKSIRRPRFSSPLKPLPDRPMTICFLPCRLKQLLSARTN